MSTIVTRAGKGTALSYTEMDANFTNLNTDKLEASALAPYETSAHAAATYVTSNNPNLTGTVTASGDIVLTGTGKRITGDLSSAVSSRLMFQTSTVNGASALGVLPNGTSTTAYSLAHNASDPTNAGYMGFGINSTESRLTSDRAGTGTYLPMTFHTGGSERMRIDTSGNTQVLGNFAVGSAAPLSNVKAYITQGADMTLGTNYAVYIQGSGYAGGIALDATSMQIGQNSPTRSLTFHSGTGFVERMRIEASGNVLVTNSAGLGYGTGAGGTVTQATSKFTAVTLNKPAGKITMHNAALGANMVANFILNNSLLSSSDVLVLNVIGGVSNVGNYNVWTGFNDAGNIQVYVRNISAGSLSEAVIINFAIIKGAWA